MTKKPQKTIWIVYLIVCFIATGYSQNVNLVLLGNTAEISADNNLLNNNTSFLPSDNGKSYLIGLGDYTDDNGIGKDIGTSNTNRLELIKKLSNQFTRTYLVSGDRDWDNSGKKGLKKAKELEDYIEKKLKLKKAFTPSDGCPGPEKVTINDNLLLILINSQWFLHPYDRPEAPETDCQALTEADFWEELEDLLDSNSEKRIVIAAHHPVYSSGRFAGKKMGNYHFIPVIGSVYVSFRKNIGKPGDVANEKYKLFSGRMRETLANHKNIIYTSAHELNTEISRHENNIHINTGSIVQNKGAARNKNHLYIGDNRSITTISVAPDKNVVVTIKDKNGNEEKVDLPWISEEIIINDKPIPEINYNLKSVIAGNEYAAGGLHRFWMGDGYRDEWTTPVEVPVLLIDEKFGGLIPYAKGGGLQTNSLKFKAADGRKYSFRSINKNPERALGAGAKQTVYKHIVKDLITTQHPYGGLVAAELMNHTDILHVNPELFYMPDQSMLGIYRDEFAGSFGTLELRPDASEDHSFGGSDKIVSSHQMFRNLYKNDNHKVDKMSYARARVFDMWMGDWDRHQDNWKWASYKEDDRTIYKPIPRDRDHVFSQWQGIIPSLADFAVPNAEHFDYEFKNLKHLNWKARHLDRQLGNELTAQDWKDAATYLQSVINEDKIVAALDKLPKEVRNLTGQEIKEKLKNRLSTLPEASHKNYLLLAQEVDVVGSNKKETFRIESQNPNTLDVSVIDKEQILYQRSFYPKETKIINLYGLEGEDDFIFDLNYPSQITIRIISGKGKDNIDIVNTGTDKNIKVYDKFKKDKIKNAKHLKILKHHQDPVYDNTRFEYPSFFPFIGFKSSSGNGKGFQASLITKKRGFNKPDFSKIFSFRGIYYPEWDAYNLTFKYNYNQILSTQNLRSRLDISTFYSKFPFFYGFGNDTERDDELYEDEFYRIDYSTAKLTLGLEKIFWKKSNFYYYVKYEYNDVKVVDDEVTLLGQLDGIEGLGKQNLLGIGASLDLNFKDSDLFTRQGSHLLLDWTSFFGSETSFTKISGFLAQYQSIRLFSPTTFVVRAGFSTVIGEAPFYQQSTLGSNSYLRGHVRNRFIDRSALFYNTEMRVHLGTWRTVLAPIKFGVFGFHDSGKVFSEGFSLKGDYHPTFGAGFYAAPLDENYSLTFSWATSDDKEGYFKFEFGWNL